MKVKNNNNKLNVCTGCTPLYCDKSQVDQARQKEKV